METLVECLSIAAVSIAAVLIVFVVGAAIVAVVEGMGKKENISGNGAGERKKTMQQITDQDLEKIADKIMED